MFILYLNYGTRTLEIFWEYTLGREKKKGEVWRGSPLLGCLGLESGEAECVHWA